MHAVHKMHKEKSSENRRKLFPLNWLQRISALSLFLSAMQRLKNVVGPAIQEPVPHY
jgi:hypothetical protein